MKKKLHCGIFISEDGFGHMVRQSAVINELLKKYPGIVITVFNSSTLFYIKEKFENKINYVNIFNNLKTVKKKDGSLNIKETNKYLKKWELNKNIWYKKVSKYFPSFDFIISDCVPEAFDLSSKYDILSLGISHFTWDWFYEHVCKFSKKKTFNIIESLNKCDHFLFPPFTPKKILERYKGKIDLINFIVGDFENEKRNNKRNDNYKKCLIMDNGTRSLSTMINKTIPYLLNEKKIEFTVCIDHLEEKSKNYVYESKNFIPVSGLKNMHSKLIDTDIVIARGGFNTLSECLVLKKPALLFDEKNNPEVGENLKALCVDNNFAKLMRKKDWGKNLIKKLRKFVDYEARVVYKNLEKAKFKSNGAKQVVDKINHLLNKRGIHG